MIANDDAWVPEPINGAALLDNVERFLARFVAYPSEHDRVAHVLWIAHTWFMDAWESTPRIAFLSPEPGSGKSRALEVTEPLVPRPVHAVNTTPAYLFRKVSDEAGPPTILFDEIDTVFGPRAKDNEDIRGMLNAGHRKGAMAGRCVLRGRSVETEELSAYCAVALAGLDDLPDTLMTRSVVIRMRRRAPHERVEPWRPRLNGPDAEHLAGQLVDWSNGARHLAGATWPEMPVGVEDRAADVWEALIAVADLVGEEWPNRARVAAVTSVTDPRGRTPSLGVMLLRDLRAVFATTGKTRLPTEVILSALHDLDESPWTDMRGKELDARGLARRLSKYDVKPKPYRDNDTTVRGYHLDDLADPFDRYLDTKTSPQDHVVLKRDAQQSIRLDPRRGVTDVTSATGRLPDAPSVTEVTHPEDSRRCAHGVPDGGQSDPWIKAALKCTQCRAEATAS